MKLTICFCLLFVVSISRAETCPPASPMARVVLDEDQLLISVLRLNGRPVLDGFDVYPAGDQLLIPASLFADALVLDWNISVPNGTISSAGSEKLCRIEFSFDLTSKISSSPNQDTFVWAADDFDIYIDARLLESILPVKQSFDFSLLHYNLFGNLPFNASTEATTTDIPRYYKPDGPNVSKTVVDRYQTFTTPLLSYRVSAQDSAINSSRLSTNINAGFDFLNHATNLRVSRTGDASIHYLRFTKTYDADTIDSTANGFTYDFGDIQLERDELVTRTGQSLGFMLHNGNARQRRNFSSVTIEEFVLPGWRVQLFRNGQFIDEKFSNEQNIVLFEDVETYYGTNLFELKLYGPEGQQESRSQTVNVGNDQLTQGKYDFLFGLSDNQYRLLDGQISDTGTGKTAVARVGYGLSDAITVSGSFQRLWLEEGISSYVTAALNTQLYGSALQFEISDQDNGGYGMFLGWNGRFSKDFRFNFSTRYLHDFTSDAYRESFDVKQESSLRLNGKTKAFGRFGWNASVLHKTFEQDTDETSFSLNMNDNLLGGTFASGLSFSDSDEDKVTGRIYYAKELNGWNLASTWNFNPIGGLTTDNFYVSVRWPQLLSQYRETRIQYMGNSDNTFEIRHQHNWRWDSVNIGLGASLGEGGDWAVNLSLTGNVNLNPFVNQLNFDRSANPSSGRIDAFAYLDENRNQRFDPNELPVEGVKFNGNSIWRKQTTSDNGFVRLSTGNRIQSISLDASSLPDPYMQSAEQQVRVVTHAGGTNRADFPIHTVNDVEGTVYLVGETSSRGASSVKLTLIDGDNRLIAQTRTESDGYFYVANIPPGDYTIIIDDAYLAKNNLEVNTEVLSFVAPREGDSVFIDDIRLSRIDEAVEDLALEIANISATNPITSTRKFEIQIGIFRYTRSIFEVMKNLPVTPQSIQIYRHHSVGLTYVTLGKFATLKAAHTVLASLNEHPAFNQAFISPTSRYSGEDWRVESTFSDIQARIDASFTRIEVSNTPRICQLAAYRALSSINPAIFNHHPELMLLPDNKTSPSFYRLLAPQTDLSSCSDNYYDHQYRQGPFAIERERLLTQG